MGIGVEISLVVFILCFMGFIIFIQSQEDFPSEWKIMNDWDYAQFGIGTVAITGTCVITTGIPCAAAMAVYGILTMINYTLIQSSIIKLLLLMPMSLGLVYVISRLARGGG